MTDNGKNITPFRIITGILFIIYGISDFIRIWAFNSAYNDGNFDIRIFVPSSLSGVWYILPFVLSIVLGILLLLNSSKKIVGIILCVMCICRITYVLYLMNSIFQDDGLYGLQINLQIVYEIVVLPLMMLIYFELIPVNYLWWINFAIILIVIIMDYKHVMHYRSFADHFFNLKYGGHEILIDLLRQLFFGLYCKTKYNPKVKTVSVG